MPPHVAAPTRPGQRDRRLPVVVSVNVEPDPRVTAPDGSSPWDGVEPTMALIESWRSDDDERRVGWYWRCDPSIGVGYGDPAWGLRRWRNQIADALDRGDEVGPHTHYWRWSDPLGTFVSDAADTHWVRRCIEESVHTMRNETDAPARVVMLGDGYVSPESVRVFDELGVAVDLTLEPGGAPRFQMVHTEYTTGSIPDRRRSPHRPFRPSPRRPVRPGRLRRARHWALPLTSCTSPTTIDGVIVDRTGTPANLGLDPWRFRHIVASGLEASARAGAPYLHVVVRTDIGVDDGLRRFTRENLAWLADGMDGAADRFDGVRFVTPLTALETLGVRSDPN